MFVEVKRGSFYDVVGTGLLRSGEVGMLVLCLVLPNWPSVCFYSFETNQMLLFACALYVLIGCHGNDGV